MKKLTMVGAIERVIFFSERVAMLFLVVPWYFEFSELYIVSFLHLTSILSVLICDYFHGSDMKFRKLGLNFTPLFSVERMGLCLWTINTLALRSESVWSMAASMLIATNLIYLCGRTYVKLLLWAMKVEIQKSLNKNQEMMEKSEDDCIHYEEDDADGGHGDDDVGGGDGTEKNVVGEDKELSTLNAIMKSLYELEGNLRKLIETEIDTEDEDEEEKCWLETEQEGQQDCDCFDRFADDYKEHYQQWVQERKDILERIFRLEYENINLSRTLRGYQENYFEVTMKLEEFVSKMPAPLKNDLIQYDMDSSSTDEYATDRLPSDGDDDDEFVILHP